YSIQHTAYSIQHTAYSIQHTAYSIQHTAYNVINSAKAFFYKKVKPFSDNFRQRFYFFEFGKRSIIKSNKGAFDILYL
ncbi:MAG: hypothetical protein LBI80_00830, partial [Endomicrobium sp.]|nr:hypothetical protein [Endomicrobium sp.]